MLGQICGASDNSSVIFVKVDYFYTQNFFIEKYLAHTIHKPYHIIRTNRLIWDHIKKNHHSTILRNYFFSYESWKPAPFFVVICYDVLRTWHNKK